MNTKPYTADDLECKIDTFRQQNNWNGVLQCVEKFAHTFAIGGGAQSRHHDDVKSVRAYYWTVMAEIMIEKKRDYSKAFSCIKKSSEISPEYDDWRILLSRILLDQLIPSRDGKLARKARRESSAAATVFTKNLKDELQEDVWNQNNGIGADDSTVGDTISIMDQLSLADPTEYDAAGLLEEIFMRFKQTHASTSGSHNNYEKKLLLSALSHSNDIQRNALLAAMNIVSTDVSLNICNDLLKYAQKLGSNGIMSPVKGSMKASSVGEGTPMKRKMSMGAVTTPINNESLDSKQSNFLDNLLERWILLTCHHILLPVTANKLLEKYFNGELTSYRLWLTVDSVYAHSVVMELIEDYTTSRNLMVSLLKETMNAPQLNELSIRCVPIACMNLCTLAACRLPLIEYKLGLKDKAISSMKRCVAPDFALKSYIPYSLYIGILVEYGFLLLSKMMLANPDGISKGTVAIDEMLMDSYNAYSLARDTFTVWNTLKVSQNMLLPTDAMSKATAAELSGYYQKHNVFKADMSYRPISMEEISPARLSLLRRLPDITTNPCNFSKSCSSSLIGVYMCAVSIRIDDYRYRKHTGIGGFGGSQRSFDGSVHDSPSSMGPVGGSKSAIHALKVNDNYAEPLEWGLGLELTPPLSVLWALGSVYMRLNMYQSVVNICEQCHDLITAYFNTHMRDGNCTNRNTNPAVMCYPNHMVVNSNVAGTDFNIHSCLTYLWGQYTEVVPCTAPMSRMVHVLIHEYADHKAAITRIYRGLCSTFKFETYGDLTVEIMEACQTLNAVEHMSLCPLEMFAPGSGYSKGSSKRPGSGSFQPPNPTVGISGGTLQENGSTCFYLDKEDQGEDSDGEFEVVGAQDNHINGVRDNGTNARSSGNAMERLFSKLRNFGHRAKRYCLSREELFMVFGYVYLLGITHAHWSRDRAITAAGRSLHQLTAYYCLHALCAADESSNSEVVRQYLCLLCEMGWTSIALGVAEDYSSKDPSDAVTKHLLSLHRCELNLKKNDEDEIRSNSNIAELPRLKGFDYSLFVPLLNLKFRLGHLPYVHLMTALNYMLTYFENNSECVGGLKGNLLSYVHDIGRLVIHHCIPYVKHGAALRIGVNSDSRSGIYSFDSVPCNDFSILRHIVSILHEAALTNTHSPIGSSSSTGVHKFNVDNKKNGTATSKMELINRNYNSMYVPVNSLTATANSKKALPQLKITSTNVADAVTWYKHHYTDNHCNYNGAFNYSVLDADEGIVTPHYNKQLTIEFLCRLIHLHLVRSAGENGMDGFEDGKILLQEAWNLIYSNTVDDFSSIPHYRQSTNQIKHLNEEDQVDGESLSAAYVSNVQRSIISEGNVHRDADVADRGQANASVVTSTAALNLQLLLRSNEFERIEMLRQIPTLFGWRVVEGSGMNYHSRWGTHIQADLLYYCGRYIYDSNRRYGREMSNNSLGEVEYEQKAREMYMLALSMHNHHIPSLIAIIELDLQLLTHTNNHVNDLSNDSYKNIVCTKTSEADCAVNDCDSPNSTCIVLKDKIHVLLQSVVECICCNDQTLNSKMDQLYRNSASVGNRKDAQAPYTHPFGFQVYYLYGQYYEFCKLTNEAVHCYGLALQYQQNEQNHKNLYNYCNILLGKN